MDTTLTTLTAFTKETKGMTNEELEQYLKGRLSSRSEEFCSHNILEAMVGTTGSEGWDKSRPTFLNLENRACTDWRVELTPDQRGGLEAMRISFRGDAERETFIDALEWAARTLRALSGCARQQHEVEVLEGLLADTAVALTQATGLNEVEALLDRRQWVQTRLEVLRSAQV